MWCVDDGFIPLSLPYVFHKDIDVLLKIAERNGNICNSSQKISFGMRIRLLIAPDANMTYYTSRENTLIPLDESHVSRLLATCVSVGLVTAGATQGVAPAVKETTH